VGTRAREQTVAVSLESGEMALEEGIVGLWRDSVRRRRDGSGAVSFFDLTLPVENGMTYYPGDTEPSIVQVGTASPWIVSELRLGSHTGTHVTRLVTASGCDPDRRLSGRAICRAGRVVAVTDLADDQPSPGRWSSQVSLGCPSVARRAVHGWDRHVRDERCLRHPYLAAETARA